MPALRASVRWVSEWSPACVPDGDAIVATAWQSVETAAAAPDSAGRKFYFIQHFESLYHGDAARVDATYRTSLRKIVISTWLADVMARRFDSPAAVIVTPVDPTLFHPVAVDEDGTLRVLMLFHEYPWKGVAEGIEAFQRVRARHPNAALVGFGIKPPKEPLPFAEFHANLPQERLAWLYSRCPIYLCPSWDEGLGMPSMEAMACGAALCTYDNGGSRDYAIDGRTAVVAPRRNLDALASGLTRLLDDAELRRRVGRDGQDFVRTQFDWERATARLESILAAR
jgi:glycosyltransferase involved in cell wall biosynthesis